MPKEETNVVTRAEWRELGFFYDIDNERKEWMLRGSRAGLLGFARILFEYSINPRRQPLSEHEHLGPYYYLTIGTWTERVVDDHWIAGTQDDIQYLSVLISERVSKAKAGDVLKFRDAFAPVAPFELILEVCGDEFDPAVADELCWPKASHP